MHLRVSSCIFIDDTIDRVSSLRLCFLITRTNCFFFIFFFLFLRIIVSIVRQFIFFHLFSLLLFLLERILFVGLFSTFLGSLIHLCNCTIEPVPRDDEPVVLGPGQLVTVSFTRDPPTIGSNADRCSFRLVSERNRPDGLGREILAIDRLSSQISFFSEKAERILIQRNR